MPLSLTSSSSFAPDRISLPSKTDFMTDEGPAFPSVAECFGWTHLWDRRHFAVQILTAWHGISNPDGKMAGGGGNFIIKNLLCRGVLSGYIGGGVAMSQWWWWPALDRDGGGRRTTADNGNGVWRVGGQQQTTAVECDGSAEGGDG